MLNEMKVPVAGIEQPISVVIAHDAEIPEGAVRFAPDTRKTNVLVTLQRGANVHGTLQEDFFVCRDDDCTPQWTLLWRSISADQAEDGVQRIEPFCMLAAGWQPEEAEEELDSLTERYDLLLIEGLILFWAFIDSMNKSGQEGFFDEIKLGGGLLAQHAADLALKAAKRGDPVDLSWLG
jgi:hypothetical protein